MRVVIIRTCFIFFIHYITLFRSDISVTPKSNHSHEISYTLPGNSIVLNKDLQKSYFFPRNLVHQFKEWSSFTIHRALTFIIQYSMSFVVKFYQEKQLWLASTRRYKILD